MAKQRGIAQGEARGSARTRVEDILGVLNSRGLEPTRGERELIESCDDLDRLHAWFNRALSATSVAMVFEDLSEPPASGISYKSSFVERWYQEGLAAGEAKAKAECIALGAARARAEDILCIFKSRGLKPTHGERELIESCDDVDQLRTWFERALTDATVWMVFED